MASTGDDCYFFYYSMCKKAAYCPFRHSAPARGTEEVCPNWAKGSCVVPNCPRRHMVIKVNRGTIPCYWESQPTGCQKPHCPFKHAKERPATTAQVPHDGQTVVIAEKNKSSSCLRPPPQVPAEKEKKEPEVVNRLSKPAARAPCPQTHVKVRLPVTASVPDNGPAAVTRASRNIHVAHSASRLRPPPQVPAEKEKKEPEVVNRFSKPAARAQCLQTVKVRLPVTASVPHNDPVAVTRASRNIHVAHSASRLRPPPQVPAEKEKKELEVVNRFSKPAARAQCPQTVKVRLPVTASVPDNGPAAVTRASRNIHVAHSASRLRPPPQVSAEKEKKEVAVVKRLGKPAVRAARESKSEPAKSIDGVRVMDLAELLAEKRKHQEAETNALESSTAVPPTKVPRKAASAPQIAVEPRAKMARPSTTVLPAGVELSTKTPAAREKTPVKTSTPPPVSRAEPTPVTTTRPAPVKARKADTTSVADTTSITSVSSPSTAAAVTREDSVEDLDLLDEAVFKKAMLELGYDDNFDDDAIDATINDDDLLLEAESLM